jgi:four helix bundle protein
MGNANSFKGLIVWQKAHLLVLAIYKATKNYPKEEVYSLTNQVRRAAVSVAANIAEGYKKKTTPNKLNFLNISEGSLEEVKYYITLSKDLEYINEKTATELDSLADEVGRLLHGYSKSVFVNKI